MSAPGGTATTTSPSAGAHPPRASAGRLAGLEGYRGLAALLVVVFHVYQQVRTGDHYPLQGMWLHPLLYSLDAMVDLFFVLSAFLLGLPYCTRALAGGTPLGAGEFLRRRAIRVVPLYLVVITVVWASRNGSFPGEWRDLLEHLTFTQVYDDQRIFYTVGPAWSLAVEVQFYLLLAVLGAAVCAVCRRVRRPRVRTAVAAAPGVLLVALGVGWKVMALEVWHRPETDWSTWFSLPPKLDAFGLGLLLALFVAARGTSRSVPWTVVLAAAALSALVLTVWAGAQSGAVATLRHTWASVGFACLLGATVLAGRGAAAARFLESRPITSLGLVSYSLYLWHEPLMIWLSDTRLWPAPGSGSSLALGVAVLLPVALLVAWASYWVVEHPASLLRRTRTSTGRPRAYYFEDAD